MNPIYLLILLKTECFYSGLIKKVNVNSLRPNKHSKIYQFKII